MTRPLSYSVPQRVSAFAKTKAKYERGEITKAQYDKKISEYNASERAFKKAQADKKKEERKKRQEEAFLKQQEKIFKKEDKEDAIETNVRSLKDKLKDLGEEQSLTIDLQDMRERGVSDREVFDEIIKFSDVGKNIVVKIGNEAYTLSDKTRQRLLDVIRKNLTLKSSATGSDEKLIQSIKSQDLIVVENVRPKKQKQGTIPNLSIPRNEIIQIKPRPALKKRQEQRNQTAFFQYNNLTHFDLSRYGVFQDNNPLNYNDTCLIYALRMGGCSEEKLNKLKLVVKNRNIPRSDLHKICEIAEIQIKLKTGHKNDYALVFGKEYNEVYHIGALDNHAFIIEPTNITIYAIKNYDLIKDEPRCNIIYAKRDKYYIRDEKRCADSFDIIKTMLENKDKVLKLISVEDKFIASTQFYDKVSDEILSLDYNEEKCCKPIEPLNEKKDAFKNVFFDFETDPNGVHKPYLCRTFDGVHHKEFIGSDCGLKMLFSLTTNTRLIAHNCTYDFRFIVEYLQSIEELARGNRLISAKGRFRDLEIEVKDSYHLISMPLRSFPEVFGIKNTEKEVMPYALYTQENIQKELVSINDALKLLPEDEHQQFIDNLYKWNIYYEDETFDIIKYSSEYCKIDCEILYSGYTIFRSWIKTAFNLDINTILTCASLAHRYFINEGCYKGVYELGGIPQMFIQGCVVGGRVMCAENKKIKVDDFVNDFDAVSLYPSAMSRMDGFLKGKPKVIKNLSYDWLSMQDGYFVDIRITGVNIKRKFPLISYKNDDGVRSFSNEIVGRIVRCDKTSLEDFIKYQGITFEIIRGYYFDEGYNTKVRDVIKYIFNKRLEEKKNKNPIEMVYKLIMNSGYGKSIMKPVETRSVFFDVYKGEDDFIAYLNRNYNWITSYVRFGNKIKVNLVKTLVEHFNIAQVGVCILSQSKRIMNEVMCLAEDNNIDLYYQDTDSMHLKDEDISKLADAFKNTYGRELIGKNLGQFHSDFKLDGCKDIVAIESIFLGKKCYIDKLRGIDENGNEKYGYHIRMKGIPEKCIDYVVQTQNYDDPMDLYNDLYDGKPVCFDLTNGGTKANFKFNKDYTIETLSMFSRKIQFA